LDEAPYKLSGVVAKLAGITFWSIDFFLDSINLGFFLREKLADVLIIPSSWGSQLDGEKLSTPRHINGRKWFLAVAAGEAAAGTVESVGHGGGGGRNWRRAREGRRRWC
jgi:hypothetical protein